MAIGKLNNLHREKGQMRSKPYRLVSNWSAATRCIVYRGVTSRRRTGGTTRGQREHTSVISHQLAASAERCVYARVLRARAGFSPIQHSLGGGTHTERERDRLEATTIIDFSVPPGHPFPPSTCCSLVASKKENLRCYCCVW